jgi:ParB family transcriptional regulator, chromosome partitioning protein
VTTPRTGGLGRGLGALIPSGPGVPGPLGQPVPVPAPAAPTVAGARFLEVDVDKVSANPLQPRQHFDEEALAELVHSIREVGLLQPVVVRQIGDDRYELVMGERRWRAAREAGMTTLPAIVRDTSDDDMLRDALLENLHRQELNPLEEGAAYQQLLAEFGATHEELAQRIGRSRPQISNTIRLLQLPPAVQRRVAAGVLSAGHARAILGLPSAEAQEVMAARVVAEGMSVRAVEEAVALAQSAGDPEPERAARARRPVPAGLAELADRLSDRFETRVKVDMGRSKGKVVIEFASVDDLQRIVGVIEAGEVPGEQPTPGAQDEPHHEGHERQHDEHQHQEHPQHDEHHWG